PVPSARPGSAHRAAPGIAPTPRHSTARWSDSNCSCVPIRAPRTGCRRPAPSGSRRVGCRAGQPSRRSRGEVGLDDLHPLLMRAGRVELVLEPLDHVGLHIGDVDVELLIPTAKLVDRSILLTKQWIVDARLVLPDLDVLLEAHLDKVPDADSGLQCQIAGQCLR